MANNDLNEEFFKELPYRVLMFRSTGKSQKCAKTQEKVVTKADTESKTSRAVDLNPRLNDSQLKHLFIGLFLYTLLAFDNFFSWLSQPTMVRRSLL